MPSQAQIDANRLNGRVAPQPASRAGKPDGQPATPASGPAHLGNSITYFTNWLLPKIYSDRCQERRLQDRTGTPSLPSLRTW
jgi:hypothetical protein